MLSTVARLHVFLGIYMKHSYISIFIALACLVYLQLVLRRIFKKIKMKENSYFMNSGTPHVSMKVSALREKLGKHANLYS